MRLDRTRIAVRERSLAEILDLALRTWQQLFFPLLWASLPLILPLALINAWLLEPAVDLEWNWQSQVRYAWDLAMLVAIQAPLATSMATVYLGRAVFYDRCGWRELLAEARGWMVPLAIIQLILRGVVAGGLAAWAIEPAWGFSAGDVALMLVAGFSLALRSVRPYLIEVLALERNPLRARPGAISVNRRMASLRKVGASESSTRILTGALVGAALLHSLWGALWFLQGTFVGQWLPGPVLVRIGLPLGMWLVAIYLTVVRFLSYLDLRIRSEGWEVELQLRAAAAALQRRPLAEGSPP